MQVLNLSLTLKMTNTKEAKLIKSYQYVDYTPLLVQPKALSVAGSNVTLASLVVLRVLSCSVNLFQHKFKRN